MKEAIKYKVVEDGDFCGYAVNLPLIVQARSFDEMKRMMKDLTQTFIDELQKSINEEEPFRFIEEK